MVSLYLVIVLLLSHYLGDFLFQSRNIALTKHENMKSLIIHGIIIFGFTFLVFLLFFQPLWIVILTSILYTVVHCTQDKYIWTLFSNITYKYNKDSDQYEKRFFIIFGLDQMLHIIMLFFLASLLL